MTIKWNKRPEIDPTISGDDSAEPWQIVPFVPWRCPRCFNSHTRTYSQSRGGRLRSHECKNCRKRFRSLEIDPERLRPLPDVRGMTLPGVDADE